MLYVMQLWLIDTRVFESIVVRKYKNFPVTLLETEEMLYFVQQFWFTAGFSKEMLYFEQESPEITGLCHTRQAHMFNSKKTQPQQRRMRLQPQ